MKRFAPALAMLAVTLFIYCGTSADTARAANSTPAPIARNHLIVAAEPDAAEAGRTMLRNGGSAVDAVIAAQMVLTLVEPQSSGIGGGRPLIPSLRNTPHSLERPETARPSGPPP